MSNQFQDLYEDDDEEPPFEMVAELVYDEETGELVTLANIPVATHPDVPAGKAYLVAGQSIPISAASTDTGTFSEWSEANPQDPGPFDQDLEG